jgi:hypothetical protein
VATLISCPTCQSRLSLGDNVSAPRVRCPKCKTIVTVDEALPEAEAFESVPGMQSSAPPATAPPRPPATPPRRERPVRDFEPDDEYVDDRRPARGRRRRRRRTEKAGGKPLWIWLILALGAFITIGGTVATIAWLIHTDYIKDVAALGITLAIMTPISAVIFIISMFISSSIAGGIDFGPPFWAILKVVGLLILINLVELIPFAGAWIALVVWICFLPMLFGLDFWESCLLIVVNWVLNYLASWIVIAFLLSMIMSGKGEEVADVAQFLAPGSKKPGMTKAEKAQMDAEGRAYEVIVDVGGEVIRDEEGEVTAAILSNSRVRDEDLALLKVFKKLGTVELTGTQITDKGLEHLMGIKTLKIVGLRDTRVTEAGVQALKRALPGVAVFR